MRRSALLVEDCPDTRSWLLRLLAQAMPDWQLESVASLAAARRLLGGRSHWDRIFLDLGLPDGSGLELLRELQAQGAGTNTGIEVIVTTVYDDDNNLFGAMAAGAAGYLLKGQPEALMLQQLQQMEAGIPPLSPSIARRMLARLREQSPLQADNPEVRLSNRDTEVLTCIARGLRVSETARQLGLTENTVASYIKQLYRKLDISSRAEAALEASRRGLV